MLQPWKLVLVTNHSSDIAGWRNLKIYRIEAESINSQPLSSNVLTISATFKTARTMITADYQALSPKTKSGLSVDGSTFGVDDVPRFHALQPPHTEEEIAAAGDERRCRRKASG